MMFATTTKKLRYHCISDKSEHDYIFEQKKSKIQNLSRNDSCNFRLFCRFFIHFLSIFCPFFVDFQDFIT
eukprot:UN08228